MPKDLPQIDLDNYNFAELSKLRTIITDKMQSMRESGIAQLRSTIAEQAELLGVSLKDLMPKGKRRGRPPRTEQEQ